jgi:glutamyl-tRNA synthetase
VGSAAAGAGPAADNTADTKGKERAPAPAGEKDGTPAAARYRDEIPRLAFILKVMGSRIRNLKDAPEKLAYFYKNEYPVDAEAVSKHLSSSENRSRLAELAKRLEDLDSFDPGEIERVTRGLAADLGVGAADVIHPCRVAVTGQGVSPDIFSVVQLIGREKAVERLRKAAV